MALKLTAEDLQSINDKRLAGIIRKVQMEKPLTAREEALIAQATVGGSAEAPSAFAQNYDELAQRLGVSRKALGNWRKDPRYMHDLPRERADGRHEVAAWAQFMVRHGLNRADEHIGDPGDESAESGADARFPAGTEAQWKKALLAEKVEREKTENAKIAGTLLVAAELETPLGATFVAITNKLTQFPERVAPQVAGFTDVQEIIAILRTEIEADLTALHAAEYLAEAERVAGELPTDDESTRLLQLVTFAGQDREALARLIAIAVQETLRRIGRRVIAAANSPTIAHEVTGQPSAEEEGASSAQAAGSEAGKSTSTASPVAGTPRTRRKATRSSAKRKRLIRPRKK